MIYNFDDLSFKILNVCRCTHMDGTYDVNARPFAALSYRVSGGGVFNIGGAEISVGVGDVVFIPGNTPYTVKYAAGESIVVHFNDCNYMTPERLAVCGKSPVGVKFSHMLEEWRDGASVNVIKSCVYDVFSYFELEAAPTHRDSDISKYVSYMRQNFTDPSLDIDSLCDFFHVSRSKMQRCFNEITGVAPKKYLTDLRMKYAIDLLVTESISVSEVAYASGYRDEKYFSRIFKETYGCTPTSMREGRNS